MPLVDFVSSFYRKHSSVYDAFVGAWLHLRECRDIRPSLAQLHKCLRHELATPPSRRCLEFFMDNEIAHFIYKLQGIEEKHVLVDFLASLVSLLPADCFPRLGDFLDTCFAASTPDELLLALAYSERAVVLGCGIRTTLVDYSLRFFFEEGSSGDYSRASIVYLICDARGFEHLRSMRFIETVAARTNEIYLRLPGGTSLYLSLLRFVSYYARKEADLHARASASPGCKDNNQDMRISRLHPAASPLLLIRSSQDQAAAPYSVLGLIEFPYIHPVEIYIKILEGTDSSNLRASVIDSVLANIEPTDDHAMFVRHCVERHPDLVAPYLVKKGPEDWSPADMFQKIAEAKGDRSSLQVPGTPPIGHSKTSIVGFLIENAICDDLVFLFIWVVSKQTFCTHFGQIHGMFRNHRTFWANLWGLILNPPA